MSNIPSAFDPKQKGLRIYNLFPRIVGNITQWINHVPRIKDMKFNAIYVNPFHYPGFSGSLYAPKDYFMFNPLFIDHSLPLSPTDQLKKFIEICHNNEILFIMDLVINHTAIDCPLIQEHPSWYKHKPDGTIVKPGAYHDGKWIEWGDLAEIDNFNSPDRENLWNFWWNIVSYYLDLGVDGFRCDMAYHVPTQLWHFLINKAKNKKPNCLFLAESLGCSFEQVLELTKAGFDYLFNSSKYWDFNAPWGMEQYYKLCNIVPTISFPESHDTPRLFEELGGDIQAVKKRLLFSTLFSKGYMIPIGFEFGFRKKLDVVHTYPDWWEHTNINLSDFIRHINVIKDSYEVLNIEPGIYIIDQANWYNVFCFKKSFSNFKPILVCINKDSKNYQHLIIPNLFEILGSQKIIDISPEYKINEQIGNHFEYWLRPSEVKLFTIE